MVNAQTSAVSVCGPGWLSSIWTSNAAFRLAEWSHGRDGCPLAPRRSNGWTYRVNELLSDLITRCRALDLYVQPDDPKLLLEIAAFITALVMNHLFTGKFKRTK